MERPIPAIETKGGIWFDETAKKEHVKFDALPVWRDCDSRDILTADRVLGSGTFSRVFRARSKTTDALLAVKVCRPKYYKHALEELKTLRRMSPHPNVVALVRAMRVNGFMCVSYVALVYECHGNDLYKQMCDAEEPWAWSRVEKLLDGTLRGLEHIHMHSVQHCDLKPENIVTALDDPDRAIIIDPGCATPHSKLRSTANLYLASRFYRPPEILFGVPALGNRIDMWSYGCVALELACFEAIFPGKNEADTRALILDWFETRRLPPEIDGIAKHRFGVKAWGERKHPVYSRADVDLIAESNGYDLELLHHIADRTLVLNPAFRMSSTNLRNSVEDFIRERARDGDDGGAGAASASPNPL